MSLSVRLYEKGLKMLYKFCVLKIRYRIPRVTEFSTEFLTSKILQISKFGTEFYQISQFGTELFKFKNSVPNSSNFKVRYRILQIPKFGTEFFKFHNLVPNSSNSKILYRILQSSVPNHSNSQNQEIWHRIS